MNRFKAIWLVTIVFIAIVTIPLSLQAASEAMDGGRSGTDADCWVCKVNTNFTVGCSLADPGVNGRVDCSENMSHTWCSVEGYADCTPGLEANFAANGEFLPDVVLKSLRFDSSGFFRTSCGLVIARRYDTERAKEIEKLSGVLTL